MAEPISLCKKRKSPCTQGATYWAIYLHIQIGSGPLSWLFAETLHLLGTPYPPCIVPIFFPDGFTRTFFRTISSKFYIHFVELTETEVLLTLSYLFWMAKQVSIGIIQKDYLFIFRTDTFIKLTNLQTHYIRSSHRCIRFIKPSWPCGIKGFAYHVRLIFILYFIIHGP